MCGTAHIGLLGSRENILKAKLEILEGMEEDNPIIINNDNDMLHEWYLKNKTIKNIITYGIENQSDVMARNIKNLEKGSTFEVEIKGKNYVAKIPIGGNHFVLNSLSAICVGILNQIEPEKMIEGIENFELTKNRMELLERKDDIKIISDCYNAGYDSMKGALENLNHTQAIRKIAILGDILELGEFAKTIHQKVGIEVYQNRVDILITVGEHAKWIAKKAQELGMKKEQILTFDTNDMAIKKAKDIIKSGDCILVKASWGMKFKEIVEELMKT